MYQQFGAREVGDTRTVRFRLFIPDNTLDPGQYTVGKSPNITAVHIVGDFEKAAASPGFIPSPTEGKPSPEYNRAYAHMQKAEYDPAIVEFTKMIQAEPNTRCHGS